MVDARFSYKKIILTILLGAAVCGCATVNVPKMGQDGFIIEDDERRLQKRADEMCEQLDDGGYIYKNIELQDYLTQVTNNLLPESIRNTGLKLEVKVISEPSLNAFALPNGKIYAHTGMLAAIDNEAQLAALLAHELTHTINRHTLKQFRSTINKSAFFSAIQAPAGALGGDLALIFTQLAIVSSLYGYSQDLESDADKEGFKMMVNQGYDIKEAPKLFERLKEFIEDEEIKQPFFFSTHPKVASRIKSYEQLIKESPNPVIDEKKNNAIFYGILINQLIVDDLVLCLENGMFKTAEKLIEKFISKNATDARGYFYLGELNRQRQDHDKKVKERDKVKDYPKAIEAYDKAIALNPGYGQAFREKARVLEKQGNIDEAKITFRKYLELNPDAKDKEYIEKFYQRN